MVSNSTTFSKDDFLIYDATHRVVICRECKYAIQKNALGSHLLRHKIYRGERQRLLSSIAQLDILDPDDVQLPPAGSPPVDGLPVISGYKCESPCCDSLYASSKRMRRHWSETHGISDPPESFSSVVHLQTFFKGTKLRYFEVQGPSIQPRSNSLPTASLASTSSIDHDFNTLRTTTPQPSRAPQPTLPPSIPPPNPTPSSTIPTIDLNTLQYFHHYTTTTSLTLPIPNHDPEKKTFWPIDVVRLALSLNPSPPSRPSPASTSTSTSNPSYLTAGLLAIAASHQSFLTRSSPPQVTQNHIRRSAEYYSVFLAGWAELKQCLSSGDLSRLEEARVAAQMICIQRCCHWLFAGWNLRDSFQLRSFMRTLTGCVDGGLALRGLVGSEELDEVLFVGGGGSGGSGHGQGGGSMMGMGMGMGGEVSMGGMNMEGGDNGGGGGSIQGVDAQTLLPPQIFERIRGLTMGMSDACGKPDSAMDFFATLSATDLLMECCALSWSADYMGAAWMGMETWLRRVTEHLTSMVALKKPAALVVLAQWSLLVERAEGYFWLLKGSAEMVRRQVLAELPRDDARLRSLVSNWPVIG